MLRTERAVFMVVGRRRHHVWLEVLESADSGIRVSVPRRDDAYTAAMQDTLSGLAEGEVIEAVLVSERESAPNWRVERVWPVEAEDTTTT